MVEEACQKTLKMDIEAFNVKDAKDKVVLKKGELINFEKISYNVDVYYRISKFVNGTTYAWSMHKYRNPDNNVESDKVNW